MKAGVVGAGLMGAEIGLVFALGGHEILLHDRSEEALAAALDRIGTSLAGRGRPGWTVLAEAEAKGRGA